MRTFLLMGALCFAGLGAQDSPPASPAPPRLTPAEIELIEHYQELRHQEEKPHQEAIQGIRERYDKLLRDALPPEKYLSAVRYMGGC